MKKGNIIKSIISRRKRRSEQDLLEIPLARGYFERIEYQDDTLTISGWMLLPKKNFMSISKPKSKKKFYITTSIAYTNAEPHLGFALESIQADVLARYHRVIGDDVFFLTGTDEHGIKIVKSAEKNNKSPKQFTNEISKKFIEVIMINSKLLLHYYKNIIEFKSFCPMISMINNICFLFVNNKSIPRQVL